MKGDEIDRSQCLSLGFTADLMCSSCDKLSDFNLDILEDDCKNCCQPDSEDVVVKVSCYPEIISTTSVCQI